MEAAEDVYRYQEIDSEDEKGGVTIDSGYRDVSNRGQFNPDELYFNDMDLRVWERRTAAADGVMYGDDSFEEDEGYYDETGSVTASTIEYEEQMFQAVLSKIRQARSTGGSGVQLTPEELEIYQSRVMRPRVPAAHPPQEQHPQSSRSRPSSVPVQTTLDSIINMASNAAPPAPVAGSTTGSTRSSKEKRRSSIFGSRPKKEKEKEKDKSNSSRKRSDSNATESVYHPPPGFVVPGQDGHQSFAPINSHPPRRPREPAAQPSVPTRPHSRSTSMYSRQATVSTRTTPPRDIPGAFPGSPQRYTREYTTPVQQPRPPSSHSSSVSDYIERQSPPNPRSRPSSMQEPPVTLVPFPVAPYQHHSAEPYQYHVPGQPAPSPYPPPIPQPQYTRQLSGHSESSHTAMPRRVPVPSSQQSTSPTSAPQAIYPSPVLGSHAPVAIEPVRDDGYGVAAVDVVPQPEPTGYNVHAVKSSGKDGERKRKVKTKKKV